MFKRNITLICLKCFGVLLFVAMSSAPAIADESLESYLCIVEGHAGFSYDGTSKQWTAAAYRSAEQYVLRKAMSNEKPNVDNIIPKWVVQQPGVEGPFATCSAEFDYSGYLDCGKYLNFYFNRNSLRFTISTKLGFVVDQHITDEGYLQPFVAIGHCLKIG